MDFRILPIAQEHIEGFRTVLDSVARERRYLAFLEAPSLEDLSAFVGKNIRNGYPEYVALVGDRVVGWCDALPFERPTKAHGGVLGMGVKTEYRGVGIGRALIQATLEGARTAGLTRIELTVREDNERAIHLYRKLGFTHEGLKRNGVRVDGRYYNLVSMGLLLDEAV
jgi:ribosomal protein S18 acetylase RimI-like enzyme